MDGRQRWRQVRQMSLHFGKSVPASRDAIPQQRY